MRITKPTRVITAAVMTTVATATVVTFARGDDAPTTTSAATLPSFTDDAPRVTADSRTDAGATKAKSRSKESDDPTVEPTSREAEAQDDESSAPSSSTGGSAANPSSPGQGGRPPTTPAPAPTAEPEPQPEPEPEPEPEPSPTPKPPKKNLLQILLGQ